MELTKQIRTGKSTLPPRILLYGSEGCGKSTFGANAPDPIFIDIENGLRQINTSKFPQAKDLGDVEEQLEALINETHSFKTLVLDSVDWLEGLIFDEICKIFGVKNIEQAAGGYGKGYVVALNYWRSILGSLEELNEKKGMTILLIAHSKIEKFEDPESATYDRYSPRLHKQASGLIIEWADAVFFANTRKRVSKEDNRTIANPIGADGGERVIRTVGSPACVAKSRYPLPSEIPLSWAAFEKALKECIKLETK